MPMRYIFCFLCKSCKKRIGMIQIAQQQNKEDLIQVTHLRSYLAQVGMTVADFAKKIECSRPYLSKLLAGDRYASPRLAKDILAATDGCIKMTTKKDAERKRKEETQ